MSFLSNIFGGGDAPQINYTPPGFSAGGLNTSFNNNKFTFTPTSARTNAVSGLSDASSNEADILSGLRSSVTPGYNDLLKARLDQVNNSATKAIGDLRQNLASRRVLGSSFAQDTLARANNEFSNQRDQVVADNFLKSLSANQQLTQQEFDVRKQQFQSALDELNLEANIASNLTSGASSQLAQNARSQAELDARAQQGAGSFLGNIVGSVVKPIFSPTLSTIGTSLASGFGF